MKNKEIVESLQKAMLFRRLSEDQMDQVASRAVLVQLGEHDQLFGQQDPARRFYLLLSGQMKLFRLALEGNEKVIEIVSPGSTFAEALMFLENPTYPVSAQAIKPSQLISIDAMHFVSVMRESVDTLLAIAADLSQRLHGLVWELNDLTLLSGTCRVATYFLQQLGDEAEGFDLDLPKQTLASRLSIKPETLSRIFKRLSDAGVITIEGNHISVIDIDQLTELSDVYSTKERSIHISV
jgi:CRP-like cAMP-binding protein